MNSGEAYHLIASRIREAGVTVQHAGFMVRPRKQEIDFVGYVDDEKILIPVPGVKFDNRQIIVDDEAVDAVVSLFIMKARKHAGA